MFSLNPGIESFLASFLTIHFLLVLVATVIAITFLGDDSLLWDQVSEGPEGFVDGYRLERQGGGWW